MSDNPIGASYLYLLDPEVQFLEAAVEHLIPTDELGPGAREAGVVVYIDRQLAGTWGIPRTRLSRRPMVGGHAPTRLPIALHATRGVPHRDPRNQPALQSRSRPALRTACAMTTIAPARAVGEGRDRAAFAVIEILLRPAVAQHRRGILRRSAVRRQPRHGGLEAARIPGLPSSQYRELITSREPNHAEPVSVLDVQTGKARIDAEGFPKHVMIRRHKEN